MKLAFLAFIFTFSLFVNGQESSSSDIIREAFFTPNPNESLALLNQVKELDQLPDTLRNLYNLSSGVAYGKLGLADSSSAYLNKCIDLALDIGDDFHLLKAYNAKGVLLRTQGDHERSLVAFQAAEKIILRNNGERFAKNISDVLGNMAGIFYYLEDYEAAWNYSKRGLRIAKKYQDTSELAYGYMRLAIAAEALDSLDQSLAYNKLSSQYLETLGDVSLLAYVQNNLGNVYMDQANYEGALKHQKKALEYAVKAKYSEAEGHAIVSIAESYFQLNQLTPSKNNALKALLIAEKNRFPIISKKAYHLLSKIAEKQTDYKEAFGQYKIAIEISDSLNAADVRDRISDIETKYETEKKEAEIERLSLENELNVANLARARNAQYALAIGGIMSVILLLVFFILRYKKQKAEKEAQDLQMDAMKKRFIELHSSPAELAVSVDSNELNEKLNTPLTEREFETLKLSLEGKTNTEISESLFISVSTVKFHLRNTYSKMGVGNRKEAFQYMLKTS